MAWLSEFAASVIFAVIIAGDSSAFGSRDLRPSDHGLVFQSSPPANSSTMRSFFNGAGSSSASSSSSSSSSSDSDVSSFPEATNLTASLPPPWWSPSPSSGGGARRLGGALVVASLVCGVTGVALLVATGLVYLFKHRRRNKLNLNESFRSDGVVNIGNDDSDLYTNGSANKLQLVPVPVVRNS
ncbi:hypothetical protein HN51_065282 [Arachis hypogaea]|uniref:Uncharacterized protein n=1 Tax=Arachis hypogaea TaxID=3818 RepID=A0A444ZDW5_ARAHY|nr:uncharacterized protein LOC107638845 [Arachis ipaensis]XP_025646249.1 uncharacterized protein LOC112741464 [Arachis hypogaea]QHO06424.1 uncharacterized protein DS421_14g454550 [Arachis hypogaea]RYR12318.1 hypothetical protein Ahy_B04g069862 [Arachis hypogaea]